MICFIAAGFSLSLFCLNVFLPETPYYVLMKKDESKALLALKKFRSSKYDIDKEIAEMAEYKNENNIRRL